jgi:ParB/RepB/Spo0J family partition protein
MAALAIVPTPLVNLPIDSIRESTTNPRQHFDEAKLQELADSIKQIGVQQPPTVRPMYDEADGVLMEYELVLGARRLRASKLAGRTTIECVVREMTDAQAREAQIVENLQRADVHPIDEAEAFNELLETLGSIPAVAARLGKEQSYIAKCLRLNSLTLPSRDALRGRLITIEHALLLARLAESEQNAALKWTLDHNAGSKTTVQKVLEERLARVAQEAEDRKGGEGNYHRYTWEPQSVVRLKAWIEAESGILLSRAPWSLTDEDYLLPDVGPCAECPKNTKANTPLFGDLEMGEATCTDGACFAAKTAGFVQIEMRKAGHDEIAKPKILVPRLSWKSSTVKPYIVPNEKPVDGNGRETANPAKLLKQGQWVEAKKGSCTNVRPGVIADWSDDGQRGYMDMGDGKKVRKPGEVLQVCIAVGCKAHRKDWEKPKSAGNTQERHDPAAEKRAREEREHVEGVENRIRSKILFAMLGKMDAAKAIHMVADRQHEAAEWRERILTAMPGIAGHTLEAFVVFCIEHERLIEPNGYWLMQPGGVVKDRKSCFDLAKSVGIDGAQIAAKYFHDAGSMAPAMDRLYPKGIAWPKSAGAPAATKPKPVKGAKPAAKKAVAKKSVAKKVAAKPSASKRPKVKKIDAAGRKRIADAMKKRWAERRKVGA